MAEKTPTPSGKVKTRVVQAAALENYKRVRAGLNPEMLARVRDILTGEKEERPTPAGQDGSTKESFERKKTYETVLKFMALSKGSKDFMAQIAKSLSEIKRD